MLQVTFYAILTQRTSRKQELEAKSHLKPRLKTQEHAEMSTIQVLKLQTGPRSKKSLKP